MAGPINNLLTITPSSTIQPSTFTDGYGGTVPTSAHSANPAVTNTAWGSVTNVNTALTTNCQGYGVIAVSYALTGTQSAGNVTFEVFDGTNWYNVAAQRLDGTFADRSYLTAIGNQAWQVNVAGFQQFRVRLSTVIAGTGTSIFNLLVQAGNISSIVQANLLTSLNQASDSVINYPFGNTFQNLASNATTNLKTGVGVLSGIIVGDAGTTWQAVIYDNTLGSGTIISTMKFTTNGFIATGPLGFTTGLTFVTSGTTAGNITPVYR